MRCPALRAVAGVCGEEQVSEPLGLVQLSNSLLDNWRINVREGLLALSCTWFSIRWNVGFDRAVILAVCR